MLNRFLMGLCALLAFASSAATPPNPEPSRPSRNCLRQFNQIYKKHLVLHKRGEIETHVWNAFEAALEQRKKSGRPLLPGPISEEELDSEWPLSVPNVQSKFDAKSAPIAARKVERAVKAGAPKLLGFEFTSEGKQYFFRPLHMVGGIRKRYAADRVNELLGTDVSSRSFFGFLNGKLGLISTFVPGNVSEEAHDGDRVAKLLREGKLSPQSESDAHAYMFLIGDYDSNLNNAGIDQNGIIRFFDHDVSFDASVNTLSDLAREYSYIGATLPLRYTQRFIDGLNRLTPEVCREEFADHLTQREIEWLLFRREIILQDIQIRGAAARFN